MISFSTFARGCTRIATNYLTFQNYFFTKRKVCRIRLKNIVEVILCHFSQKSRHRWKMNGLLELLNIDRVGLTLRYTVEEGHFECVEHVSQTSKTNYCVFFDRVW